MQSPLKLQKSIFSLLWNDALLNIYTFSFFVFKIVYFFKSNFF